MSNLKNLFDQLGINPSQMGGAATVSEFQRSSPAAAAYQAAKKKAAIEKLAQAITVSGGNGGGVTPLDVQDGFRAQSAVPQDDGGGFFDGVGKVFGKAIDVIDTPRAFVASGVKELMDAAMSDGNPVGRWMHSITVDKNDNIPDWLVTPKTEEDWAARQKAMGDASWSDFTKQGWDNMGFGKILQDATAGSNTGLGGAWRNRVIGFAGDVASDPLTHVAASGKTVAKAGGAADEAIMHAVSGGARNDIAMSVAAAAKNAGLDGEKAVQELVSSAAKRGRGALTRGNLAKLGVDSAMAEKLGIPTLGREFVGAALPGGTKIAEGVERTKGAIKEALGETAAARYGRSLRFAKDRGLKNLVDVARSEGDSAKVMDAVKALVDRQAAKQAGTQFGHELAMFTKQEFGKPVRQMSKGQRAEFTHLLESVAVGDVADASLTGAQGELVAKMRTFLSETGQKLKDMGVLPESVDVTGNYVPHMLSDAAKGSKNSDIRSFVKKMGEFQGFQKERLLKPGLDESGKPITFMGEEIKTGSIAEINDISVRHTGVKLLEEDIANILPSYMGQVEQAVIDRKFAEGLINSGVATNQAVLHHLDDAEKYTLDTVRAQRDHALAQREIELSNGMRVRQDQVDLARQELHGQRTQLNKDLEQLRLTHVTNARNLSVWSKRVAQLEAEVPHLEESVSFFRKQAARLRGNERKAMLRKVAKAESALDVKATELGVLQKRIAALPDQAGNVEDWAARYGGDAVGDASLLSPQVAALQGQLDELRTQADELLQANTPLGDRPIPQEQVIKSMAEAEDWAKRTIAKDKANIISTEMDNVAIESKIAIAEDAVQGIEDVLTVAGKKAKPRTRATVENVAAVRDHAQQVIDVAKASLEVDNPTLARLMDLEVRGAIYDANAVDLGDQAGLFRDMIVMMNDPKFGSVIEHQVDKGFAALNGTHHQIPGWLDDALKVQSRIKDPSFWPGAAKAMNYVNNLWKGWATMRPGFVVRNAYSSTFSFYLEAGNARAVGRALKDFEGFYRIFKNDPVNYMEHAVAKYGEETAGRLNAALGVVSGTGGGLAPAEVATNVFRKKTANPFSPNFAGIRATRSANESIEGIVRGAHAYDVLLRSGDDVSQAMQTVEKWHFNYKETTDFDRVAKQVIPFWTFFSRNTALQAHVWTHNLPELNRSYMNLQRNMALGQEQDQNVPDYIAKGMPIPLETDPNGTSRYLNLDVGPTQFARDAQNLTDPKKFLGSSIGFAPPIGLGMQAVAGENLYTGAPNDRMVDPGPAWGGLLGGLGLGEATGSGGVAVTQFQRDALNGLLPGVGTANRLTDTSKQSGFWNALAYAGLSTSRVTPEMRQSQLYKQKQAERAAKAKRDMLARL